MQYGTTSTIEQDGETYTGFRFNNSNPPKTAIVRLPTNEELVEHMKPSKKKTADYKAEQKLFEKIRLDKGEPFDEYEAASVIERITRVEVISTEKDGSNFVTTLKTAFGETVHTMQCPTQKAFMEIRRNFTSEKLRSIYDECVVDTDGYCVEVPPHHKQSVASEILVALSNQDGLELPNV